MSSESLYLAAPLFNPSERDLNLEIREILRPHFEVYVPQVDGALLPDLLKTGLSTNDAYKKIFEADVDAIKRCDVFLIVLNGRTVDEGAAFELGLAWNLGKPCYGFKNDFRQLVAGGDNPMIECALTKTFVSLDGLREWSRS
ncbi:MAG: nucleoside 2-deoxyribosyltransferase [Magnetovibrio sp.]|nr:nucleoside 2-deoxyribosyltransferase [Magnetovibrio sp.]